MNQYTHALIGGLIIAIAVSIMLLFNGRPTGISGIVGGLLTIKKNDLLWRLFFIFGLLAGGFILKSTFPESLNSHLEISNSQLILAGLLVGFGTLLGNGCTSGHGICGISRFSKRSILATLTFIIVAAFVASIN